VRSEVVEHAPGWGRQFAVLLPNELAIVIAGEQDNHFFVDLDLAARIACPTVQDAEAADQGQRFELANPSG